MWQLMMGSRANCVLFTGQQFERLQPFNRSQPRHWREKEREWEKERERAQA